MADSNELRSPFKFLAPYNAKDKETFWGRDIEIREMYQMLLATNLLLLYGPSGTGKTSLVQCGLSKKFNGPDWIPLLIRRGENCVQSVQIELSLVSGLPVYTQLRQHLAEIHSLYKRPVYLFFDQFEEIFTLAPRNEQGKIMLDEHGKLNEIQDLFSAIRECLNLLPCKFIFILREEFLGQLYAYEPELPNIFDFRLRVEPMNRAKIKQVLAGTFESFNITCTTESIREDISKKLLDGNATSQLAYLQVYLDRLWRTAYQKKYGIRKWTEFPPLVIINQDSLTAVGTVEKVLEEYLDEQEKVIADLLKVSRLWIRELLDCFVTDDNTKRPILEGAPLLNFRRRLSDSQLHLGLTKLQEARLLFKDNQYYELAHDALAFILASKRTASQRLTKDITQILRSSYFFWKDKDGGLLNKENVVLFDRYKNEILDELEGNEKKEEIISYVEESRAENERESEELADKNRTLELNKSKLEENEKDLVQRNTQLKNSEAVLSKTNLDLEKTNKRQRITIVLVGILLIVVLCFFVVGFNLYKENEINLSKYHLQKANQLKSAAKDFAATKSKQGYKDALEVAVEADKLYGDDKELKMMIIEFQKKVNQ